MVTAVIVPANVSNITFAGSGSCGVSAGICSGMTDAEATTLCDVSEEDDPLVTTNISTGAATLRLPAGLITAITINSIVYNPDGNGLITNVPAADATVFIGDRGDPFQISTGV